MRKIHAIGPNEVKSMTTEQLRDNFLIKEIFQLGATTATYTYYDRLMVGGIVPTTSSLGLPAGKLIAADYFLQRREIGIINIGGAGTITIDGEVYPMAPRDGIYIGMGHKDISFSSQNSEQPAKFYYASAPAHTNYPIFHIPQTQVKRNPAGAVATSNQRVINQYLNPALCKTCQLQMGLTVLDEGSVWNTMPCHTHDRRVEIYLYFDLAPAARVLHLMGEVEETRHIWVSEGQAVASPAWSIHSGVGTGAYTFIWAMAGENQVYDDMDAVGIDQLS